jgi:tryptophan halogenase
MTAQIRRVVILGGGTAGWMCAAAAARFLAPAGRHIVLVESEAIGTVGVGEGTIPPMVEFNQLLGIPEPTFLEQTKGTFKLGIDFVNWGAIGDRYFHPFGHFGSSLEGVSFHHLWLKYRGRRGVGSLDEYSMATLAAKNLRFAPPRPGSGSPVSPLSYAYHLDASLYAAMLRKFAEARGIERLEGRVAGVEQNSGTGHVAAIVLDDHRRVEGDLFIDCSGFRSLLLGETLGVPFEDWSKWLPCDKALAVPCERSEPLLPFTRSTAHPAGWQWRIPLQHRTGNGHVYCSGFMEREEAEKTLLGNLDGKPLAPINQLSFRAGRRTQSWKDNVVAIGLSSGFLEPLESTSIYLIQYGIQKLFGLFPDGEITAIERDEYNRALAESYEVIRDFIILHYHANRRDEPFWKEVRSVPIPDTLRRKIELFADKGRIFRYSDELFELPSWLAVMLGQGIVPNGYDPLVDSLPEAQVLSAIAGLRNAYTQSMRSLPPYQVFLDHALSAAKPLV